jgi:hypothetical protein
MAVVDVAIIATVVNSATVIFWKNIYFLVMQQPTKIEISFLIAAKIKDMSRKQ